MTVPVWRKERAERGPTATELRKQVLAYLAATDWTAK